MRIGVVGTGYVGLPLGAAFAEIGNSVICLDVDDKKVESLKQGKSPIYEPGLEELLTKTIKSGKLTFTTDKKQAIENSDILFLCVGTPSDVDGSADLKYVLQVAKDIGQYMNGYKIIVDKSTVPVGTADKVKATIQSELDERGEDYEFDVVSNPEFMREGTAVYDMLKPDRVVIGTEDNKVALLLKELYEPFVLNGNPIIITSVKSAEMIKYASNCFLATKITFMNEMANICEQVGANVDDVRRGMGTDSRISHKFLYASPGYGGSCFGKDVRALYYTSKIMNVESQILKSVTTVNDLRPIQLIEKSLKNYGENKPKKVALWGLSFKPETDDIREAPSLKMIKTLLEKEIEVNVYDPMAMDNVKEVYPNINYFNDQYECLKDCDALFLVTEWKQFRNPDWDRVKGLLNQKIIFDGRNQYKLSKMKSLGFKYYSIGRPSIK